MIVGLVRLERERRQARRADGGHARDVVRVRLIPCASLRLRLARTRGPHTLRWPRSRSSSSFASRCPRPISHDALARRHLAPPHARRASRARRARRAPERGARARDRGGRRECVCLSTCNRTELYTVGDDAEARALEALQALGGRRDRGTVVSPLRPGGGAPSLSRRRRARLARARARARSSGRCARRTRPALRGRCSNRLFHDALHAGKKARAQTTIAESPASVPSAGAALAQQVFGDLDGPACAHRRRREGRRARRARPRRARRRARRGREPVRGARRRSSRSGSVRAPCRSSELAEELARADVAVACTSAPGSPDRAGDVRERKGRPLFLIDLAVPRDIDPR